MKYLIDPIILDYYVVELYEHVNRDTDHEAGSLLFQEFPLGSTGRTVIKLESTNFEAERKSFVEFKDLQNLNENIEEQKNLEVAMNKANLDD